MLEECPDEFDKGGRKEVTVSNQAEIKICFSDEAIKLLFLSFSLFKLDLDAANCTFICSSVTTTGFR